ncbi:UDP-glucose/GDP-mannose dehydrogenase family, UDP binding domain protein [Francisella philomiragia]|uniref:UDP binding domain-containing protein n=1 Tax=Francisella philomiragia TaxID=28110 RepID=UPI0005A57739|nr:UDP binding domain-containing protein [Francisella philomiragia]AJI55928.1 UDP-glucose/GDP-mannose dehydrogenase family, UDP binding domain protein [Francisella philomiragia]
MPKDTKQLLSSYHNVPSNIIEAIVKANTTRKRYIASKILAKNPTVVGIYRLVMKNDSDNFRESSVVGVISELRKHGVELVIYEPNIKCLEYSGIQVINNITLFKKYLIL